MVLRRLVQLITALSPHENNVINNPSGAAGVYDTLNGASILAAAQLQATFTAGNTYNVDVGLCRVRIRQYDSDSLQTGVAALGFPEDNANNQCIGCNTVSVQSGQVLMGTSTGQTALQPAFSFIDFSDFSNVSNGTNPGDNETPPQPNFLISYAVFLNAGDPGATFGAGLYLTSLGYGHCGLRS